MRRRLRRIVGSDRVLPAAGVRVGHVKLLVCIRVYDFPAPHPRVRARDTGAVGCSYCSEPGRQRARMSPLAMTLPVPLFDPLAHQAPVLRASFWIQKPRLPRPIRPGKAPWRRRRRVLCRLVFGATMGLYQIHHPVLRWPLASRLFIWPAHCPLRRQRSEPHHVASPALPDAV